MRRDSRGRLVDYYAALGVPHDAAPRDIEAAYWRLAMSKRDELPLLNEAYEVLSHAERRAAYDEHRGPVVREAPPSPRGERPAFERVRRTRLHDFLG